MVAVVKTDKGDLVLDNRQCSNPRMEQDRATLGDDAVGGQPRALGGNCNPPDVTSVHAFMLICHAFLAWLVLDSARDQHPIPSGPLNTATGTRENGPNQPLRVYLIWTALLTEC